MRSRLQRAERRAFAYEDRIRGFLRARDGRQALNVAVAHLQGELSKRFRRGSEGGLRLYMLTAGIVEGAARAVQEWQPDGDGRPSLAELSDWFERGLRQGEG